MQLHTPGHLVLVKSSYVNFFGNWLVTKVLEAATWRSNSVFSCFYFKNIQYVPIGCYSLGPFVTLWDILE